LTALLYATGVVSEDTAFPVSGRPAGPPRFAVSQDRYVYEADVIGPKAAGYLRVVVGYTNDITGGCAASAPQRTGDDCVVKDRDGVQIAVVYSTNTDGERQIHASAKFKSGVRIAVTASNTTRQVRNAGDPPPDAPTVLSDDQVCMLVSKVGLSA
jgi:hypothetical protein